MVHPWPNILTIHFQRFKTQGRAIKTLSEKLGAKAALLQESERVSSLGDVFQAGWTKLDGFTICCHLFQDRCILRNQGWKSKHSTTGCSIGFPKWQRLLMANMRPDQTAELLRSPVLLQTWWRPEPTLMNLFCCFNSIGCSSKSPEKWQHIQEAIFVCCTNLPRRFERSKLVSV